MAITHQRSAQVHPPGTVLQHMYLGERLSPIRPGRFVEIGIGSGHISQLLLSLGWSGSGYDLNPAAVGRAAELNSDHVVVGRYSAHDLDWLASPAEQEPGVDLVVSSMVLEHLDDDEVKRYFEKCAEVLRPGGRAILIVPGSPRHWGIEDEIAGHFRRYTATSLGSTVSEHGWSTTHLAGLTYPMSNLLLGASNLLVRRAEQEKTALALKQRTELSGDRAVGWKTEFPPWLRIVLNEKVLLPFHLLQKRFSRANDALVIYCECVPPPKC
jgi:SAM-dependent methyltransferase